MCIFIKEHKSLIHKCSNNQWEHFNCTYIHVGIHVVLVVFTMDGQFPLGYTRSY